jgi:hypothetical protein
MSQNRLPLNVATVTLKVAQFSLTVKCRNTAVKLCQYKGYVSDLGTSYLSDMKGFAVISKILVKN